MVQHPLWLSNKSDPKVPMTGQDVIDDIRGQSGDAVAGLASGLGNALAQVYARSAELLIERINKLPENYFRAFLNSAGVDLLPPKPASTELTFTLPFDGPPFVTVQERTQVATQQSETQPEVVFETVENIVVTPNRLLKCVTFDPLNYSDQTEKANSTTVGEAFTVFEGAQERERMMFLGDKLLSYHEKDDAAAGQSQGAETADADREVSPVDRQHTVFELCFELVMPCLFSLSQDVKVLVKELVPGPVPEKLREQFQRSGIDLAKDAKVEEDSAGWTIVDGNQQYLVRMESQALNVSLRPALTGDWKLEWYYWDAEPKKPAEPGWAGLTKFLFEVPISFAEELDAATRSEKLRQEFRDNGISLSDGARVTPAVMGKRWTIADTGAKYRIQSDSTAHDPITNEPRTLDVHQDMCDVIVEDDTSALHNDGVVRFRKLPVLTKSKVGGEENYWIACKLTGGQDRDHLPAIRRVRIRRYVDFAKDEDIPVQAVLAATQGGTLFAPQDTKSPLLPFGPLPQRLDAFYVRADHAFNEPGAPITLEFNLDSAPDRLRKLDGKYYRNKIEKVLPKISWEYRSENGWEQMALFEPRLEWTYTISDGWRLKKPIGWVTKPDCEGTEPPSCRDTTSGFTEVDSDPPDPKDPQAQTIILTINKTKPIRTKVNDQEGYWIRARIHDGAFGVEGELEQRAIFVFGWTPQVTFAPVMQNLKVKTDYTLRRKKDFRAVEHLFSRVDETWRLLAGPSDDPKPFDKPISSKDLDAKAVKPPLRPFDAADEGPALYLGFERAFPAGEWIRLLLDVDEAPLANITQTTLTWQFRHETKKKWQPLDPIDDTLGLVQRNYLGFYAPDSHGLSTEFGQSAYWIRATLPTDQRPQAGVVANRLLTDWKRIRARGAEVTIPLSVKTQLSYDVVIRDPKLPIVAPMPSKAALIWHRPSSPADTLATVRIDASPSKPFDSDGSYLSKYVLRSAQPSPAEGQPDRDKPQEPPVKRRLRGIRLNTVFSINKETIEQEVIGLSNGGKDQSFNLVRKPVLDDLSNGNKYQVFNLARRPVPYDIVVEVQEFDPPAKTPDTSKRPTGATGEIEKYEPGEAKWNEWSRINNFDEAGKDSRVYVLDPIEGKVHFGDGERGVIPLAGSKIRASRYCAHAGKAGNVQAKMITVLRNPAGDVAKIESVTNYEEARGGRNAESDEEVMRRGPRFIKNQDRVVSADDLAWLARQAGVEIANAFTAQSVDKRGKALNGTAQVVIIPNRRDERPRPTPKEVREVQRHLEERIQANLPATKELVVRGPDYVTVNTRVWLAPAEPEKSEAVQKAVREHLSTFLHPLRVGPAQVDFNPDGWPLGRDVFVSELYAQLESVPDVDYVKRITLRGSLLQSRLSLARPSSAKTEPDSSAAVSLTTVIAAGAQVSTLDERKKLILSESCRWKKLMASDSQPIYLYVHGFNVGDEVHLFTGEDNLPRKARISAIQAVDTLATNRFEGDFEIKLDLEHDLEQTKIDSGARLESTDQDSRLRLPIVSPIISIKADNPQALTVAGNPALSENPASGVKAPKQFYFACIVQGFVPGDFVSLFVGRRRLDELWKVDASELDEERVYVPDGYLVCSGEHHVNIEGTRERS